MYEIKESDLLGLNRQERRYITALQKRIRYLNRKSEQLQESENYVYSKDFCREERQALEYVINGFFKFKRIEKTQQ